MYSVSIFIDVVNEQYKAIDSTLQYVSTVPTGEHILEQDGPLIFIFHFFMCLLTKLPVYSCCSSLYWVVCLFLPNIFSFLVSLP